MLRDVPLHKVQDFQKSFLEMMRADHQKDVLDVLSSCLLYTSDYLPEQAFLNVGTIEEAIEKGKKLLDAASHKK